MRWHRDNDGGLFKNDMGIRSAYTKRTDSSPSRFETLFPIDEGRGHVKGAVFEVDRRVRSLVVKARRDLPVFQGEYRLDQGCHSRCGAQMSDVALH